MAAQPVPHIRASYRTFVRFFVWGSVVLLVMVTIFTNASLKITITPKPERVTRDFSLRVVPDGEETQTSEGAIGGTVREEMVSGSITSSDFRGARARGRATGNVRIINRYSKAQPLVKGTRLESTEGILFRTQETVTVPPGGEVTVAVTSDGEGDETLIGPSHFIIVALWKGIQDKIYGESDVPMVRSARMEATITRQDIEQAEAKLVLQLRKKGEATLADAFKHAVAPDTVSVEPIEIHHSVREGDVVTSFETNGTIAIRVVEISRDEVRTYVEHTLAESIPPEKELVRTEEFRMSVKDVDTRERRATVEAHLEGVVVTRFASLIPRERLLGKSADAIARELENLPGIEHLEVTFSPPWIKRSLALSDRVEVVVKK